jgi:signal transduction histidine kinase
MALLVALVATLATTGFLAVDRYRTLLVSIERRAPELFLSGQLERAVYDLRLTLNEASVRLASREFLEIDGATDVQLLREPFRMKFQTVRHTLNSYHDQLRRTDLGNSRIADNRTERQTIAQIDRILTRIEQINSDQDWMLNEVQIGRLNRQLDELQRHAVDLPAHLHRRLRDEREQVRGEYRTMNVLVWITTGGALVMFVGYIQLFYRWVLCPLQTLIRGSRKVAGGAFSHRIRIETGDEMAELAAALNHMTRRFQDVRDDLDRQVKERTKQAVRNEQLASVGFLAAGVAHEINNPLASIAMCAESLDRRAAEFLNNDDPAHAEVRDYLRMIQDEAFRCKEITESLLDFSRAGDADRADADLRELVAGVVEVARPLGRRDGKKIELEDGEPVLSPINSQRIKQVVLNLITNALESLSPGGTVTVRVERKEDWAVMTFEDDGCGMTPEVLEHLFEPFFTRSHGGHGTGLGLAIAYRIIADHDGSIKAQSEGTGRGSRVRVTLPLSHAMHKEKNHRYHAA